MAEQHSVHSSPEPEAAAESFPSTRMLVMLYSGAAVTALLMSFTLPLDPIQTTWCLVISWLLTSGALGMSLFMEAPELDEYE